MIETTGLRESSLKDFLGSRGIGKVRGGLLRCSGRCHAEHTITNLLNTQVEGIEDRLDRLILTGYKTKKDMLGADVTVTKGTRLLAGSCKDVARGVRE